MEVRACRGSGAARQPMPTHLLLPQLDVCRLNGLTTRVDWSAVNATGFEQGSRDRSRSEVAMTAISSAGKMRREGTQAMKTQPIVPPQEWETARAQLLVKEKAMMKARDALTAERRRMPWVAVEKSYVFEGPKGK